MIFALLAACCTAGVYEEAVEPKLMVFLSFSVPHTTWVDYAQQMNGGVILLRGVPNHSVLECALQIQKLKQEGVAVQIDLDPEAFKLYGVEEVPTIILKRGNKFDKVVGNVRIDAALRLFAESGDLKEEAEGLLK